MQSTLDELQHAVTTTENFLNQGERTATSVRSHFLALEEVISRSMELQRKLLELRIRAREMLRQLKELQNKVDPILLPATASQSSNQTTPASAKDPESKPEGEKSIAHEILFFDGDVTRYPVYRISLMENVINQPKMTTISKWAHLRNSLSGPPAELISEIPQVPELLEVALKVLDDVYGSNAKVLAELYRKFMNLLQSSSATESIRMTHAKLESILLSMTKLNHPVNKNQWLCSAYLTKFPKHIFFEAFKGGDPFTDLKTMREAIAQLLLSRESL